MVQKCIKSMWEMREEYQRKKGGNGISSSGNYFSCPVCKKLFKNHVIYRKHVKMHSEKFVCQICDKSFIHKNYFLNHMLNHSKTEHYECHLCHKNFTQKGNLNQHLKFHSSKKMFKCEECGKDFYQQEHLKAHMRQHTSDRPYQCEICNKSFNIKSSLQRHMNCHTGVKPFICDICKRGYTRRSVLVLHIQQVHENRKPYQCSVCQMCFSQKGNLQAHFKRKHLQPKLENKWGKDREKGRRGIGKQSFKQSRVVKKNSSICNRTKAAKPNDSEFMRKNGFSNKLHSSDNPQNSGFSDIMRNDFEESVCILSTNGESSEELDVTSLENPEMVRLFGIHDDIHRNSLSDSNDSLPTLHNSYIFSNENFSDDVKILTEFDMLLGDPKSWGEFLLPDDNIFEPCFTDDIQPPKGNLESKKNELLKAEENAQYLSIAHCHDYACPPLSPENAYTNPSASSYDATVQTSHPEKMSLLHPSQIKKEIEI